MADPTTIAIGGGLAAYLTKDALTRILGPTADYLGGELERFTRKRIENLGRIFQSAEVKLGPDRLEGPGHVPPKVLKAVLSDGSYSDDDVSLEYFGGVLASSRTEVGRDDRGARLARVIGNLSTYQVRSHYLIYSSISRVFSAKKARFGKAEDRAKMQLFIPGEAFITAMEFTDRELENPQIFHHILDGLSSDGLIEGRWMFGDRESLLKDVKKVPSDGIVCSPSLLGAELFLWAFGYGDQQLEFVLSGDFVGAIEGLPESIPGAMATGR